MSVDFAHPLRLHSHAVLERDGQASSRRQSPFEVVRGTGRSSRLRPAINSADQPRQKLAAAIFRVICSGFPVHIREVGPSRPVDVCRTSQD